MGTIWGLTGPQFLAIYAIVVGALLVLAAAVRCWPHPETPVPVRITGEELGQLVGGPERALLVAVGDLHSHGLLRAGRMGGLDVTPGAAGGTELQLAVLDAARDRVAGTRLLGDRRVLGAARRLQDVLAQRGLVVGRGRQSVLVLLTGALWAAWACAMVVTVVDRHDGISSVTMFALQAVLLVVLRLAGRALRRPHRRHTDRLIREVRQARIDPGVADRADHRFGQDVVIAGITGVPVALGGAGVLTALDPAVAHAVGAQRLKSAPRPGGRVQRLAAGDAGAGWGGSTSTCSVGPSDSGGSSGCGGSSSSCGGGGCGGGCGGGGS